MGAKTTEQLNLRRPTVKCPICGRKFLNVQALKSHHSFLHTGARADVPKRVPFKKQVETRQAKKRLVPVNMLKRVVPLASKQSNKTDGNEKSSDLAGTQANVSSKQANLLGKQANLSSKQANLSGRQDNASPKQANASAKQANVSTKQANEKQTHRPEYECPVCSVKFPVYFTAFRHIQQNHCVDDKGEKVAPNSPHLVKPVRIEICATCNKQIRSTEQHTCQKPQTNKDQYSCLGCGQIFNGLMLFQHHIKGLHGEGAQNYFFPSREEFTAWREDLEQQSNVDFVKLNILKSKEMLHCSHQPPTPLSIMHLCPCSITVREYTKGVHVCYYKQHHGHTLLKEPIEKFEQYCINLYLRDAEELKLEAEDDNDLYLQFKKMITCIVFDAAKVDVTTLKDLLGKALEMTSVLKHYEGEERNTPLISKCMTDAQISRTLESLKSNQAKRKLSPLPKMVEPKKAKKDSPIIEKLKENGVSTHSIITRSSPALNKSLSVNKDLFNKSLSKKNEEVPQEKKKQEVTQEKKKQEVPQEKKKQELSQEKKKQDLSLEKKKQDLSLEKKKQDLSLEKKKQDLSLEKKKQDLSLEKKKQDISLEKKKQEVPQEKKKQELPQEKKKQELPQEKKKVEIPLEKKKEESAPPTPVPRALLQSPSSFNDSYKNFVDQNFKCLSESSTPKTKSSAKKKEVMKTKMGQFKSKTNVLSPKQISPKNLSPKPVKDVVETPKVFKAKPDIVYEVKEQENDCNILILKI